MAQYLSALPDMQETVAEIIPMNVRYQPGKECVIQYRTETEHGQRLTYGRLVPPGHLEAALERAHAHDFDDGLWGEPVWVARELEMVLHEFPHDTRLPGLALLLTSPGLAGALARCAPAYQSEPFRFLPEESSVELLFYEPEQRAVLRWHLVVEGREGGPTTTDEVMVLLDAGSSGAICLEVLGDLRDGTDPAGPLRGVASEWLPEPLGYDVFTGAFFYREAPASPLVAEAGGSCFLEYMEVAGRLLARLHRSTCQAARRYDPGKILSMETDVAVALSHAGIAGSERLPGLVAQVRNAPLPAGSGMPVFLHGDCDFAIFRSHDHGIGLGVPARPGRGPAALDLGQHLNHLKELAARNILSRQVASTAVEQFLAGYEEAGGVVPGEEELLWFQRFARLRLGMQSISRLDQGSLQAIHNLLENMC